ncbi:MAG: hypothetical protein JST65_07705 [Acidobacteria bacterium]|nr:hypothetical protein [Acidobacteriota bacterium]
MTDLVQPEPPRKWVKGMPSPNPRGRPPGVIDKRTKVTQALADDAPEVARVVVEAALAGDVQAANLVLSRVAPALKQQAERVQFELDGSRPLAEQAHQILLAVSEGKLDAETARTLIGCIQSVASVRAVEELEHRIILLEAKALPA